MRWRLCRLLSINQTEIPMQFKKLLMRSIVHLPHLFVSTFLLLFLALVLNGCTNVTIKDETFCGDKGALGATCVHTLVSDTQSVPKLDWDAMRYGMICESSQTFADLKSDIEQLCQTSHACTYDVQQKMNAFFSKMDSINVNPVKPTGLFLPRH